MIKVPRINYAVHQAFYFSGRRESLGRGEGAMEVRCGQLTAIVKVKTSLVYGNNKSINHQINLLTLLFVGYFFRLKYGFKTDG